MIFIILAALLAGSVFFITFFLLDKTAGDTAFLQKRFEGQVEEKKKKGHLEVEKKHQYSDIRALNAILLRQAFFSKIHLMLKASGWGISVSVFVLISLIGALFLYLILVRAHIPNMIAVPSAVLALFFVPSGILTYRYARYVDLFDQHFPMALQIIRGAVGIGLGISSAFERVSHDAPYPINKEFQTVVGELQVGESMAHALAGLYKRIRSKDTKTFVVGVAIQQESGGNLSELMSKLEATITARVVMRKELKALTAQARLSGWIISTAPFIVALILNLLNPGYLKPLFENEVGRNLVTIALVMMVMGALIVKKMVNLRIPF